MPQRPIVTDTKDPNWGRTVTDTTDPNWGLSVEPQKEREATKAEPSALSRFGTGVYENFVEPVGSALKLTARYAANPDVVLREAAQAGGDEGMRLLNLATTGNQGKSALNWVPFAGPALAKTADKMRAGNYAGAGGDLAGMALPTVLAEGATRMSGGLQNRAVSLEGRMLKPKETTIRSTDEFKATGSKTEGQNAVARTLLEGNRGTIRPGNEAKGRTGLDDLDTALTDAIANSQKTIPKAAVKQALMDAYQDIGSGSTAQANLRAGITKAWEEIERFANDIPVQTAQKAKQTIYRTRNYASTAADAAAANADKVLGRAYRSEIEQAVPDVAPINAEFRKQIPAQSAMENAVFRTGKRDPMGVSQMLWGAVKNPVTTTAAIVNHPAGGSFLAQRMFNAGKGMSRATLGQDAQRALILAMLAQQPRK